MSTLQLFDAETKGQSGSQGQQHFGQEEGEEVVEHEEELEDEEKMGDEEEMEDEEKMEDEEEAEEVEDNGEEVCEPNPLHACIPSAVM